MRAIVLTAFIAVLLPFVLRRPEIGAYLWAWVSMMNPHKLTWGFAYSLPFAQIIAIATLIGFAFSKQRKPFPVSPATIALVLLVVWMTVTSVFALNTPEVVWDRWFFVLKIHLMLFVTLMLLRGRVQIDRLIWVVVVSIGFFGVKGGIWTLLTGGSGRVWGPPGGMISDNNALAVALILILPLMYYLQQTTARRWIRYFLMASMAFTGLAILGSQSRGAFLGLLAMAFALGLKGKHPVRFTILLCLLLVAGIGFMPDTWTERMNTILAYGEDGSSISRIYTWQTLWNVAAARPLVGAGFAADNLNVFAMFAPTDARFASLQGNVWVAHSIYFQALGEHGFPGLLLYLLIWLFAWFTASRVAKQAQELPETSDWAPQLMRMCQAAIVGFCVGGAFLSLMNLDVPFYLVAIVVLTQCTLRDQLKLKSISPSGLHIINVDVPNPQLKHSK